MACVRENTTPPKRAETRKPALKLFQLKLLRQAKLPFGNTLPSFIYFLGSLIVSVVIFPSWSMYILLLLSRFKSIKEYKSPMLPPSFNKKWASPKPPMSSVPIEKFSPVTGLIALLAKVRILFLFIENVIPVSQVNLFHVFLYPKESSRP